MLSDSSTEERSPLALIVSLVAQNLQFVFLCCLAGQGCVPRVSSLLHHQGALASFQHLQNLYDVPQQEVVFYLQHRQFFLATLPDYLLLLATDLESLLLRWKSLTGFVLRFAASFVAITLMLFRCRRNGLRNRLQNLWWPSLLVENTYFHV